MFPLKTLWRKVPQRKGLIFITFNLNKEFLGAIKK